MNRAPVFYEEGLYAPETVAPAETRERPPNLELCKCQCRCCGCICVSTRAEEARVDPLDEHVDSPLFCSTLSDDSDERFNDRYIAQEGVEDHSEADNSEPWIEAVMTRLALFEQARSPEIYEPMDGILTPPSLTELPGLDDPESMYDSMYNEPNSGPCSMADSVAVSIYNVLHHSGLLTSVGATFGEQRYIFTAEPLRLSYEQEHCRNTVIGVNGTDDDEYDMT